MKVFIAGPNLRDQSKGTFEVHAEGCADIAKKAARDPEFKYGMTCEAEFYEDVAGYVYSDHMAEAESEAEFLEKRGEPGDDKLAASARRRSKAEDYVFDFHFLPCCKLKKKEAT